MTNPGQLEIRLQQSRSHYSHPSFIFGDVVITGNDMVDEYLAAVGQTILFGFILYFVASSLSYWILFKKFKKQFTPLREDLLEYTEQKYFDIKWSVLNVLGQAPLVALIKTAYPYYSKIQYDWNITYLFPAYVCFHLLYDEFLTYWAHRLLHQPFLYRWLHSIHHSSKAVTPYSGFAFHPLDAFAQAVPVFTSCYFVPLPIDFILVHGVITSLWAISIHDNVNMIPFKGILYAGSHSIHHFPWGQNYNYGKISSVCDRLYGSYCDPEGITGYGYKPSPHFQNFIDQLNAIYERLVPDMGKQTVEKESRNLFAKKIKQKLGNKEL